MAYRIDIKHSNMEKNEVVSKEKRGDFDPEEYR